MLFVTIKNALPAVKSHSAFRETVVFLVLPGQNITLNVSLQSIADQDKRLRIHSS